MESGSVGVGVKRSKLRELHDVGGLVKTSCLTCVEQVKFASFVA